ncbi:DUF2953 domain-containing protein [Parageobacillus thermoglucosidasius]|uniref:DUF2953 domain-containing protein n=1 Tax=Parageobacillus thermoglucosidasius TaxID=1426 RepID=UPI000E1A6D12|nr:DUF2953 domain-containing protein [Parageobacillus thermoglucosidasius]RDE32104.1 DUF2953 domain-containing protein [Parageobacillus thermoglucosidasius]
MLKLIVCIAVLLFFLLFLLSLMKLSVTIFFQHAQGDDEWKITFQALFGMIRYTIHIPFVKIETEPPGIAIDHQETIENISKGTVKRSKYTPEELIHNFQKAKEFAQHVVRLNEIIKKFLGHISITKFEWQTKIGTGDAATTGMIVGLGWSLKYHLLALSSKYMKLKTPPFFMITPSFHEAVSETKFVCMIHFRIGYAMLAGIRMVKYWRGNRLSKIKTFVSNHANESY